MKDGIVSNEFQEATVLNCKGYELFRSMVAESEKYMFKKESDGRNSVHHLGHENSKKYYSSLGERCDYSDSKAQMRQCCHEYCRSSVLILSRWGKICHRRDGLTQSKYIGDYKNPVFQLLKENKCLLTSEGIGTVDNFSSRDHMIEGPINDVNLLLNVLPIITNGKPKDQRQISLTETSQKGHMTRTLWDTHLKKPWCNGLDT